MILCSDGGDGTASVPFSGGGMTDRQWDRFSRFRDEFKTECARWQNGAAGWLPELQLQAAAAGGTPPYPVETPVVYNTALEDVTPRDDISLIIVSDNPGKEEQRACNRKYLVGQAGKLGARFFSAHPEMNIDYRKNVVILNKTPVHSARTKQLDFLLKKGGDVFKTLFEESQMWMAARTAELQRDFSCPLWIVGYGELRPGGLFAKYAETLTDAYLQGGMSSNADRVLLFQHFSMNRFSIDLRDSEYVRKCGDMPVDDRLRILGKAHRKEILGW